MTRPGIRKGVLMRYGLVKVAAATPPLKVADCAYNADMTIKAIEDAEKESVKILVLPEFGLTGYTCGDLFLQDTLIEGALRQLKRVAAST